jgi:transcriptional regulator with XRE-family HTH domain
VDEDDDTYEAPWERNFRQQMMRLREAQEMTQTDLARKLKHFDLPFHQQTIQRIESGERPIRLNEAHLIAHVLGVTVESMLAHADTPSEQELRYAVDRLRRRAAVNGAVRVHEAREEWGAEIQTFLAAISGRAPHFPEQPLDDATRWGVTWALLANNAYSKLSDAWAALVAIAGVVPFDVPAVDVLGKWSAVLPEDTLPSLDGEATNDLYASFPGDGNGEHPEEG